MELVDKKIKETISDIKEWLEKPNKKQEGFERYINKINDYLKEQTIRKSIIGYFEYINYWYSNNFVYELLTTNKTTNKTYAAANGYHILMLTDILSEKYANRNPPYMLFDKVAYWFANCLSMKWYVESNQLLQIINNRLGKEMLDGGLDFKPTAWFIVEMANKGYHIDIDLKAFNYPKSMGVYQEALDHWNTKDVQQLDAIISKLCNFHLLNATCGEDEENTADIQFDDSIWFVYAFEIVSWLSIREMVGLENPTIFSHPLMNLTLNQLPSITEQMPKNVLYEKAISRLEE